MIVLRVGYRGTIPFIVSSDGQFALDQIKTGQVFNYSNKYIISSRMPFLDEKRATLLAHHDPFQTTFTQENSLQLPVGFTIGSNEGQIAGKTDMPFIFT